MSSKPSPKSAIGITLRTALLSWFVTSVTLLIFVIVIIPQQRHTFEANLASKAHGIAVSLHDVAAAAAINEDYSSVVDYCSQMIDGDQSIDYLVVTKNDGDAQILQREKPRWHSEKVDAAWHPDKREPTQGIGVVPLLGRRVFHYAQPFDYSGIQWGWIHVGLSLASYDQSVAAVYWRTGILAVICILFGLVASIVYAKRLVQPILSLQLMVRRVAGGDLTARAEVKRGDELGSLASSVNSMTDTLLRKDRVMESVRVAAQQFLSTSDWTQVVSEVLAKIGAAAEVSRLRIFQIDRDAEGRLARMRYEWIAPGVEIDAQNWSGSPLVVRGHLFEAWASMLEQRQVVAVNVSELNEEQKKALRPYGFKSILLMPIMVEKEWWGFITFADCVVSRLWTDAEQDSLRAVADMLGTAIARHRTQTALVEAKETLEQRVRERTKELEELVLAKDRAHAELAEAQHRLLEASRHAGMAEVATGVLHNVGNVLNSVNVSSTLIRENLRQSELASLKKVSGLLQQHTCDLGTFLTEDPKGKLVPGFLIQLTEELLHEHNHLQEEHEQLSRNIEHVKEIVAVQQNYARVSGVLEKVSVPQLVEDALQMNIAGLNRHQVRVVRQYAEVPPLTIDKHKVLQILVNLMQNAKYALDGSSSPERRLTLRIGMKNEERVQITVQDNGIGIMPENLTRIFSHGFTTRKDGHGFGLHSGANAAKEMGGLLAADSEGVGKGAIFTLELPVQQSRTKR